MRHARSVAEAPADVSSLGGSDDCVRVFFSPLTRSVEEMADWVRAGAPYTSPRVHIRLSEPSTISTISTLNDPASLLALAA